MNCAVQNYSHSFLSSLLNWGTQKFHSKDYTECICHLLVELQALFNSLFLVLFFGFDLVLAMSIMLVQKNKLLYWLTNFIYLKLLLCLNSWDHLGVERQISGLISMICSCITEEARKAVGQRCQRPIQNVPANPSKQEDRLAWNNIIT